MLYKQAKVPSGEQDGDNSFEEHLIPDRDYESPSAYINSPSIAEPEVITCECSMLSLSLQMFIKK